VSAQTQYHTVDYVFAGAGASATLLIMSMAQRGLLLGKTILILDPDAKFNNDKTYCFWVSPDELEGIQCKHLISHKWDEMSVNRNQPELLHPLQYVQISSLDLYEELRRLIIEYKLERIQANVLNLITNTNKGVKVITNNGIYFATTVFDSRPPQYLPTKKNEVHLLQSFVGYVISTKMPIDNTSCIDLMDFAVEQQACTQFVYVLPFSNNKILVELTRFGLEAITNSQAEPILNNYISQRFGEFKILNTETGCIPMSTAAIAVNRIQGVIAIGGRDGAVKPSTGYAFKNMCKRAELLAENLQKHNYSANTSPATRFRFYDRLLLLILSKQPNEGKPIFQALFKKNKLIDILRFLDEKTLLNHDMRIFCSLPLKPFLIAWWQDTRVKYRNLMAPIFLLLMALSLWILNTAAPHLFNWAQFLILTFGLFSVGIPHGAVDHLLESGNLQFKASIAFILPYLGAVAAYLLVWLIFPNVALVFFLIYSAWHFGQADMQTWQPQNNNPIKNWIWGVSLLSIILFAHVNETNQILSNMNVLLLSVNAEQGKIVSVLLILFTLIWGFWERRLAMVLSSCMLLVGSQLPLISAFGLYFIGQHSLNGWSHLKQGMNITNKSLFWKAFPFTIGAFMLFAVMLYCLKKGWLIGFNSHWITAFFVFISCISFPHVIAMHRFYKKNFV
jgi:lycopene beta-cyclase